MRIRSHLKTQKQSYTLMDLGRGYSVVVNASQVSEMCSHLHLGPLYLTSDSCPLSPFLMPYKIPIPTKTGNLSYNGD